MFYFVSLEYVHRNGNTQQNNENNQKDSISSVGLTECKAVPGVVEFAANDPLGRRAINQNSAFVSSTCPGGQGSSERIQKSLGEQASVITSAHDRAIALRRTTVAAQIHLSRELVLRVLSVLCRSLSKDIITHTLEIMGLGAVKILVNLMRLVASGRAYISKSTEDNTALLTGEEMSPSGASTLEVLGQAVSSLVNSQPLSAQLLLQVCVNDLMASATGESFPYAPCIKFFKY